MWGKDCLELVKAQGQRNTPTCVGKSKPRPVRRDLHREHPHVCGEKFQVRYGHRVTQGTPPRVWGKEMTLSDHDKAVRNTPTFVGKSREKDPS